MTPPDAWGAKLILAASESALLLCGAAFALSSGLVWERGWRFAVSAVLLSVPPVAYVTAVTLWVSPVALLAGLGVVAQVAFGAVILRFGSGRRETQTGARAGVARRWGGAILVACAGWLAIELKRGHLDESFYPLLSEIFFLNARDQPHRDDRMVRLLLWRAESRCLIVVVGAFSRLAGDRPGLRWNCRAK